MSKKYKNKTCVYCLEENSSRTGDHVIARQFFLESRRANLPQVPACVACNGEKSELEHYLTSVLPFSGRHPDARENLREMVPARLKNNTKLRTELATHLEKPSGDVSGGRVSGRELPFNGEKYTKLLRFISRGLAWNYFDMLIPKNYFIGVLTPSIESERVISGIFAMECQKRVKKNLGNGTVNIEGAQSDSEPFTTIWRICFYEGLTLFDSRTKQQGAFWAYVISIPARPAEWDNWLTGSLDNDHGANRKDAEP